MLLDSKSIYITLAHVLDSSADLEFAALVVQTLSLILLTASELGELRAVLKQCLSTPANSEERAVFTTLFGAWCHSPIATFSLCLLAQAFEAGATLISRFADVEVTVGFLMQIDKLVQLLESPVFVHLRLQLLESEHPQNGALLKSLYGLLMLLPQSKAFETLRARLQAVSSMHLALAGRPSPTGRDSAASQGGRGRQEVEIAGLLVRFEAVQLRHTQARSAALRSRSLLADVAAPQAAAVRSLPVGPAAAAAATPSGAAAAAVGRH